MPIEWSQELTSDVVWIDNQHKKLIERINKLAGAILRGKGGAEVGTTLNFLEEYVKYHFSTEDKYMLQSNFPDYVSHKEQHTNFMKDIVNFKERYIKEGVTSHLVDHVQTELADWYLNHIKVL